MATDLNQLVTYVDWFGTEITESINSMILRIRKEEEIRERIMRALYSVTPWGYKLEVESESVEEALKKFREFSWMIPSGLFPLNKEGIIKKESFVNVEEKEEDAQK